MLYLHKGLRFMLGIFLLVAGANHFLQPDFYLPILPEFMPLKNFVIAASGWVEVILGFGLFIPKFWKKVAWGIVILFVLFLPLHVIDLFRETPAMGTTLAAFLRLLVQGVFIAWAWFVARFHVV